VRFFNLCGGDQMITALTIVALSVASTLPTLSAIFSKPLILQMRLPRLERGTYGLGVGARSIYAEMHWFATRA
jgi:hypothetical protein